MLLLIINDSIVSYLSISNAEQKNIFLENNPDYIESDFNFTEELKYYHYKDDNFSLLPNFEELKAKEETDLISIRPLTDITASNFKIMIDMDIPFDFTSNLPDDTYFMPVMKQGSNAPLLFVTAIKDGKGILTVHFKESGVYYIDESLLSTDLSVNGDISQRFTLYVGQ